MTPTIAVKSYFTIAATALCVMVFTPSFAADNYEVGICTHAYEAGYSVQMLSEAMGNLGVSSFRGAISWEYVEKAKGAYGIPKAYATTDVTLLHSPSQGIRPLLILDYGNPLYEADGLVTSDEARVGFANYVRWMVNRYKGKVRYYEIWNEWFIGMGSRSHPKKIPSVSDYVSLLKAVYPVIKSIDPSAVVLGGGAGEHGTEWFQEFVRLGGQDFIDGMSIHPYVDGAALGKNTPEASLAWVEEVHRAVEGISGKNVDMYVTEVGWPAHARGYHPTVVAAYLGRYLLLAKAKSYIKGVWWYDLYDDGPDEGNREHRFGLLDRQLRHKPVFDALKAVTQVLDESRSVDEIGHDSWIEIKIVKANGKKLFATWAPIAIPGRQTPLSNYMDAADQSSGDDSRGGLTPQERIESERELGKHSPLPIISVEL